MKKGFLVAIVTFGMMNLLGWGYVGYLLASNMIWHLK